MQNISVQIPGLGRSAGEGIGYPLQYSWASLVARLVKDPPAMQETWVWFLSWEDAPGEGKGYPLQYSGLENSKDCILHGVPKSQTQLSDLYFHFHSPQRGLPNLPANAGDIEVSNFYVLGMGFPRNPQSGRSPGGGHGNPLQLSCLENPMNRGAWQATVYRIPKIWTQLKRRSIHILPQIRLPQGWYITLSVVLYVCTRSLLVIHFKWIFKCSVTQHVK